CSVFQSLRSSSCPSWSSLDPGLHAAGSNPQPLHAVAAVEDALHPGLVVEVPVDRAREAALERFGLAPAEVLLDLRRIDRVAAIVARAVLHVGDQAFAP